VRIRRSRGRMREREGRAGESELRAATSDLSSTVHTAGITHLDLEDGNGLGTSDLIPQPDRNSLFPRPHRETHGVTGVLAEGAAQIGVRDRDRIFATNRR
jgi:hypothetical protein